VLCVQPMIEDDGLRRQERRRRATTRRMTTSPNLQVYLSARHNIATDEHGRKQPSVEQAANACTSTVRTIAKGSRLYLLGSSSEVRCESNRSYVARRAIPATFP
jgi:hypothetical protein